MCFDYHQKYLYTTSTVFCKQSVAVQSHCLKLSIAAEVLSFLSAVITGGHRGHLPHLSEHTPHASLVARKGPQDMHSERCSDKDTLWTQRNFRPMKLGVHNATRAAIGLGSDDAVTWNSAGLLLMCLTTGTSAAYTDRARIVHNNRSVQRRARHHHPASCDAVATHRIVTCIETRLMWKRSSLAAINDSVKNRML